MKFKLIKLTILAISVFILSANSFSQSEKRLRCRDIGLDIGILKPGNNNAITDVAGVKVGHKTIIKGNDIRTGVTAIIPHSDNVFQNKVKAAVLAGNGFGKAMGFTQVQELGNIETPIVLTNTLSVPMAAHALLQYMLKMEGNERVGSVNCIVAETNDGGLNDIRGLHVKEQDVWEALNAAKSGPVEEGSVGAGTGTSCLGFKGGIGTSSRVLPERFGGYAVGVLVQSNFGGILSINGAPVGRELGMYSYSNRLDYSPDGSCMIIIATDAPLSSRNLKRLAKRSMLAFGKVGSFQSNGSGDYAIAFSTNKNTRVPYSTRKTTGSAEFVHNDSMSPLFLAVSEAAEEAILNSMFMATDITGNNGRTRKAIPIAKTLEILKKYNVLNWSETLPSYKK